MTISRLGKFQTNFCEFLMRGRYENKIAGQLRSPSKRQAIQRLDIYRNGYFIRLEKALAHDFPISARVLGQSAFARVAGEYVLAHPSKYPSLRKYGHVFADWLRVHVGNAIADLADIEWAIMTVFDGPDGASVQSDCMDAFVPNRWANMCVTLVPTLTLLSLASNADDVWLERGEGRKLEKALTRCVAISRGEQFRPKLFSLDSNSFTVLDALRKEPRLAIVSEQLAQQEDSEKIPELVAKALHIAFANKWVADVSAPESELGL